MNNSDLFEQLGSYFKCTPNKFIVGAYADSSGYAKTSITGSYTQTGGTKDAIVVSHTHTATSTVTDPGHSHTISPSYQTNINSGQTGRNDGSQSQLNSSTSSATTGITVATSNSTTGSSGTDQNLPPYYALAFIMKA